MGIHIYIMCLLMKRTMRFVLL
eukprot:UN06246